jgi:hypothetical protein
MSIFGHLFKSHGMPSLFRTFGDDSVDLIYRIGDTDCRLQGIKRHEAVEMRQDDRGSGIKVRVCQIVISTEPTHPWGGIADPQATATWTIRVPGKADQTWAVDTEPGKGIESITESRAVIHLVRETAATRSHVGLYK